MICDAYKETHKKTKISNIKFYILRETERIIYEDDRRIKRADFLGGEHKGS